MKMRSLEFVPLAGIDFSADEIGVLMTLSEHHYDGTCRMASKLGGFIFGLKNSLLLGGRTDLYGLKARDIDLLLKILECPHGLADASFAMKMRMSLQSILDEMREKTPSVIEVKP